MIAATNAPRWTGLEYRPESDAWYSKVTVLGQAVLFGQVLLESHGLLDVEGLEVPVSGGGLEPRRRLGHRVNRVLALPFGLLQEGEVLALDPLVVGVVHCHGLMLPIPSHCSRWAERSRLVLADRRDAHAVDVVANAAVGINGADHAECGTSSGPKFIAGQPPGVM